jgi:histidine triad (HIT) family protein
MASVFTKIINGEIPAHKVAETSDYLAFLDINPLNPGHTLAIPKKEVDYIFDLDEDTFIGLHLFTKEVADAILKSVDAKRIATAVLGLEVPHAHIHLIPINAISDMDWNKRGEASEEELREMANKIRSNF